MKKIGAIGCAAWILGLTAFIVGLNLSGTVREVLIIAGSLVFLAGLFCVGIFWIRNRKE